MPPPAPAKQAPPTIENFDAVMGMETREARDALQPGFWRWLLNFQPIGRRTLRALLGVGSTLYTAGHTILCGYSYIIGTTQYIILFLSDGSAVQVQLSNGNVTTVGSSGTFWSSGAYPHVAAWGNNGIVIVSTISSNAFWAWDGSTLYNEAISAGAAPAWLYGTNSTKTMPSGVSGTAVEVYNSQVWIVNGTLLIASQPGCGNNFATSGGGVSFTATDSYVQTGYNGLRQLDGYLYLFADAGVDVISDVSTSGSPATTTFLRTNVDPKIGTQWRDSIIQTPTSILFSNPKGIYEVAGGATRKVSVALDGLFGGYANFTALTFPTNPSAFIAQINNNLCYGLTATITDPFSAAVYKGVVIWDGQRAFVAAQEKDMDVVIGENNASILTAWGCDTTHLYPAFNTPSSTLTKEAQSWFSPGKSGIAMRKALSRVYAQFSSAPAAASLPSVTIDTEAVGQTVPLGQLGILTFVNNSGGVLQFQNNSSQNLYFSVNSLPLVVGAPANVICLLFGLTFSTQIAALDVVGLSVWYDDTYSDYA